MTENLSPSSAPLTDTARAPDWRGATRLDHWGVIRALGPDAATFLHGQLTQDFALLGPQEARLAAFCNAKGRMQASFIGFKTSAEEILLICPRELLASTLKRLSMFVLRAKVKLSDATGDWALYGALDETVLPSLPAQAWAHAEADGAHWVRLYPAAGHARALLCQPISAPAPEALLPPAAWDWLEVRSGVAMLNLAAYEHFVPQMLNYESVGGVNFKKGCYPGQEVVARSQFRGTLKRRAYLLHAAEPMHPGQDVFHASDAEQPCGLVVQAAPNPQGGWDAISSLQIASADGQPLTLATPGGAALHLLPLPYELLQDI